MYLYQYRSCAYEQRGFFPIRLKVYYLLYLSFSYSKAKVYAIVNNSCIIINIVLHKTKR